MEPFVSKLFKKLEKKAGVQINLEPEWKIAGQIVGKNGKKKYFRNTAFDINTLGATEIAQDKDYSAYFLKLMKYPVVEGKAFYSDHWSKAIGSNRNIHKAFAYAKKIGLPVFVKPNSLSQGFEVHLVRSRSEFYSAMRKIFKHDRIALVQKPAKGNDYRIVILNGKIISAYQRLPLSVLGDGKSSILKLLREKQRLFIKQGRDTKINFKDPRMRKKLFASGLRLGSIPAENEKIFLLDNANLSTGGDAVDVTKIIHLSFKKISIAVTKDMGLRYCGVDMIVEGNICDPVAKYKILEINAAPGLDHYFLSGKKQQKIVEDMYLQVLKGMR